MPRVKREVEAYSGDGSELPQIKYSTGTVIASERGGAMAEQDGSAAAGIELSEVEGRAAAGPAAPQVCCSPGSCWGPPTRTRGAHAGHGVDACAR